MLPEGTPRSASQWNTRPPRQIARKNTQNFFNKRKGGTSNPTRKVFPVQRRSRARSPIRVGDSQKCLGVTAQTVRSELLWIRNPWLCDILPVWFKWLSHYRDWAQRPRTTFQFISHVKVGYSPPWFTKITCVLHWKSHTSRQQRFKAEHVIAATCAGIRAFYVPEVMLFSYMHIQAGMWIHSVSSWSFYSYDFY